MPIYYQSATEIINSIKNKQFSCVDVMQAYLDRVAVVNPSLNAMVQQLDPKIALRQAQVLDEKQARGEKLGALHGLPMTIKDHIKVKDFIVTRGTAGLKEYRCTVDAPIVAQLKKQGAIIIGISNMPEFGPAFETDNDVYGRTNNPYDMNKTSGGSSGGEAALIASGGSAAGIGTDGGGSIRVPAHFCGIAGHKPTQHLVSCTGNVPGDGGMGMMFYTPGPMARYVEDLQLILPLISGGDSCDPYLPQIIPELNAKPVNELRIGYVVNNSEGEPDDDTVSVFNEVIKSLTQDVYSVKPIDFLDVGELGRFLWEFYFYGGDQGLSHQQLLEKVGTGKASPTLQRFLNGAKQSPKLDANQMRAAFVKIDQIRMQALQAMQEYDVIISPVAATPAKQHATTQAKLYDMCYTMIYNLLGWPATTVRCGTSQLGLPLGMQIAAKPWDDGVTLGLAKHLQTVFGGWQAPSV